MSKKHIAEFIGTFALSFVVLLAVSALSAPVAIPVIAGLTLALFVYSIGPVSGCHINPSVTLGQLSIKKISPNDAVFYIIAQLFGAFVAMLVVKNLFLISTPVVPLVMNSKIFFAEVFGAFFFNFGIASVVYGKAKEQMSGLVVGGSLLLGLLVSSLAGAAGILNPAVAVALGAVSLVYMLAPIVGAVLGAWAYKYLAGHN